MLIEFTCNNLTGFDPATGRSAPCGARLVAPEDKIGEEITCKSCGQMVQVPIESILGAPESSRSAASRRPAVAATKAKRKGVKRPGKKRKANEATLADPVGLPTDVMTFEFEAETGAKLNTRVQRRCPKCGAGLSDGRCSECRYVEKKYESSFLPLDKIKVKPAGFQLYAGRIFNEGVSINLILVGFHLLVAVLTAILILCSLLVGGTMGILLLGCVLLAGGFYLAWVIKGYSLARNPRAKLAWFQKPVWNSVLLVARNMKWQGYDKRFNGRVVIDKRMAPIVDDQLAILDGLTKAQVLYLEGTLITDSGISHLYGLENLHCLVVRKTKVTPEALFRLQQSNPKMWIWY